MKILLAIFLLNCVFSSSNGQPSRRDGCITRCMTRYMLRSACNCDSEKLPQINGQPPEVAFKRLEKQLESALGDLCIGCFSYSTHRTLDCLRRPISGRVQYLERFMCLRQ